MCQGSRVVTQYDYEDQVNMLVSICLWYQRHLLYDVDVHVV